MITEYKNKMQENSHIKYAHSSPAVKALIESKYKKHQTLAFQVGAKPMELNEWLEKEGY